MKITPKTLTLLLFVAAASIVPAAVVLADSPSPEFEKGRSAANSRDFTKALKIWMPLAESGDPRAEYNIGRLYAKGDGVGRDLAAARQWFKKAAEHGLPEAQNALAKTYYYGDGGPRDQQKAVEWFRRAAANGEIDAKRRLSALNLPPEPVLPEKTVESAPLLDPNRTTAFTDPGAAEAATKPDDFPNRAAIGEIDHGSINDSPSDATIPADTFVIEQPPSSIGAALNSDSDRTEASNNSADPGDNAMQNDEPATGSGEAGKSQPSLLSKIGSFLSESEKYGAKSSASTGNNNPTPPDAGK